MCTSCHTVVMTYHVADLFCRLLAYCKTLCGAMFTSAVLLRNKCLKLLLLAQAHSYFCVAASALAFIEIHLSYPMCHLS